MQGGTENGSSGKTITLFRLAGLGAAFGVMAVPSLNLVALISIVLLILAWLVSTSFVRNSWQQFPRSLKILHIGASLAVAATVVRLIVDLATETQLPVPSWIDVISVPGMTLVVFATWQSARARAAIADIADVVDALAVAVLPVGLVVSITIGYYLNSAVPVYERILNAGFFVMDFFLLVVMIALAFGPGVRNHAAVWLACGGLVVVSFHMLLLVGVAIDASWLDQLIRVLPLAIICYAISTTHSDYMTFAQPGTRQQRYRYGVYMINGVALFAFLGFTTFGRSYEIAVMIVTLGVFLTVLLVRFYHSTLTAQRLHRIVDAESILAKELTIAATAKEATDSATKICQELLGSDAVQVSIEKPSSPIVAATERVWVSAYTQVPSYLTVIFDQVAHIVDFALDSISARNQRARDMVTVEVTTDPTTGWRTHASLSMTSKVSGHMALIECYEIAQLAKSVSKEHSNELLAELAGCIDRFDLELQRIGQKLSLWSGEASTLIVVAPTMGVIERIYSQLRVTGPGGSTITMGVVDLPEPTDPTVGLSRAKMATDYGSTGKINLFSDELQTKAERNWAIVSCFRRSLQDPDGSGFCCHYQAIVDANSHKPVAFEALIRWIHPTLGPISPGEFVPIAEEEGLIDALDRWVFDTALRDLDEFRAIMPTLKVHVNMSPSGPIAQKLEALAHTVRLQHSHKADAVVVELTETATDNRQNEKLIKACKMLRQSGAGLALDDFGTGQSNLARINRLPFSTIKLGADFACSDDSAVMLNSMMPTIKALGLPVVAENIETQEQLDRVARAGVDWVQGYLFSKPAVLSESLAWLAKQVQTEVPDPIQLKP